VPTLAELGLTGATYVSFDGFIAPAKMPADRLDTLRAAMSKVLADAQVKADLKKIGAEPAFLAGRDYDGFLQANVKVLAGIAAKANIKE
jgi:tripartite-type tricarboxylate transporter receptor subunit TctC